jgi:hypothetical protein
MFASFKYEPEDSRWSFFSIVSPRYFFYADRDAAEPQLQKSGLSPQNKPELILSFKPTVNYRISSRVELRLGTSIDYRKQIISSWNFLNASLITNGNNTAWRLYALPVNLGINYTLSSYLALSPFISTYPIAAQRIDSETGKQASILEVTSIGMWLSGTLF